MWSIYFQVEEVGQIQESLDLLNRKLNDAEHSHQVKLSFWKVIIVNKWNYFFVKIIVFVLIDQNRILSLFQLFGFGVE